MTGCKLWSVLFRHILVLSWLSLQSVQAQPATVDGNLVRIPAVLADPDGEIGIPFGIRSLPVSYSIDQQGKIVQRYRGFEPGDERQIQQDIQDLLSVMGSY